MAAMGSRLLGDFGTGQRCLLYVGCSSTRRRLIYVPVEGGVYGVAGESKFHRTKINYWPLRPFLNRSETRLVTSHIPHNLGTVVKKHKINSFSVRKREVEHRLNHVPWPCRRPETG